MTPWSQAVENACRVANDKAATLGFLFPLREFMASFHHVDGGIEWDISQRERGSREHFSPHADGVLTLARSDYGE